MPIHDITHTEFKLCELLLMPMPLGKAKIDKYTLTYKQKHFKKPDVLASWLLHVCKVNKMKQEVLLVDVGYTCSV